jgi:putative FmdB family regulatory protein
MPVYSYLCKKCKKNFELFFTFANYTENPNCEHCKSSNTVRDIVSDATTINSSVKKSDSELKTIGDLANRNRDRLSDDEKTFLYQKHNEYKEDTSEQKTLPKGMKRVKKQKGIKWT